MTRHPARYACAAIVAAAFIAGCGGGSGTKTTVRTAPAPQPTRAVVTGDPPVDQVIGAALASDNIELAGLVGYQKIACKKDSPGRPNDPPPCRETESDGTLVEVLPVTASCNSGWVRPEQVPDSFGLALPKGKPVMLAVLKPKATLATFGGGFGADQAVVFRTGTHGDGSATGVALHLRTGRVVWIEADCHNLLELIASDRVDAFIVDPNGTVTPSTPAPAASPVAALASATPPAPAP
ncbi:MAG: hypothetical protein ACHQO8_07145 [Vicinamibacterales bacterium]